jgi:mannose-6-phosphate isomerase
MPALDTPLSFERRLHEKPWGGRALEGVLGLSLPPGARVGETWEVVDRAGEENSVVAEGPHRGRTLRELVERFGDDLLGRAARTREGRFPLLVKYIDASEDLSVQVHPDDAAAARLGNGAEGKTEAWYFLAARPGARVLAGLAPDVTRERFAREAGGAGVVPLLRATPAVPGSALCVPGGTVHAIGAGIALLEVQQNSDTTFRVYDWGRVGLDGKARPVHLEQAAACARFGADPPVPVTPAWRDEAPGVARARLATSPFFTLDVLRLAAPARLATGGWFRIYAAVEGRGRLVKGRETRRLAQGDVLLVPAAAGEHAIEPEKGELRLVELRAAR